MPSLSIFSADAKTKIQPQKVEKNSKNKNDKKSKDKKDKKETVPPTKKRGRPSNTELAEREKIKREAEIALRKELLERQQKATVATTVEVKPIPDDNDEEISVPDYKTDFSSKTKDPNWIPPWPIFFPGQRVEASYGSFTYQGTVGFDNIESAMIRVKWDDGSIQAAAKMNLKIIVAPKKLKKLFTQKQLKDMEE